MNVKDSDFQQLLNRYKKFAVYGLSPDTHKASHTVPSYMRSNGWDIVGVYPKIHAASAFKIYSSLKDVPEDYRKFVDVFRSSDHIPSIVDEILDVGGVEVFWLQLGIAHPEAEARAEKAGIQVVSDRCLVIEHRKWFK
jgi:uncharacterized protein